MLLYVATKWEARSRASEVMNLLRQAGHVITYDWTVSDLETPEQAEFDLSGVVEADALILMVEHQAQYKGTYVELGAALASSIPVYVVGHGMDKCLFLKHPLVCRVASVHSLLERLSE